LVLNYILVPPYDLELDSPLIRRSYGIVGDC
jgi:hypothetical protein